MENENLEHSHDKYYKMVVIFIVLAVIATIVGSTFAYWSWQSSEAQKTAVTFTVTSGFSCSADGGGNITSSNIMLAPAECTNSTYAIKRTVKVNTTQYANKTIYLDMNLKVNSIGTGLANSTNFKYALTTSGTDCRTGVVAQGDFYGATNNTEKILLHDKEYQTTTTNDTYYLWVWLDAAETNNNTQNQPFNISLTGACTDQTPTTFSGTIYRYSTDNIFIGKSIKQWCGVVSSIGLNTCIDNEYLDMTFDSEAECQATLQAFQNDPSTTPEQMALLQAATCEARNPSYVTNPASLNKPFYLKHVVVDDIVTESYVEFVVSSNMASTNTGMTAGTYTLRGLDTKDYLTAECKSQYLNNGDCISPYFEANKMIIQRAFGNSNYCNDVSYDFTCRVPGLYASAHSDGYVHAYDDAGSYCSVDSNGDSKCLEE